MEKEVCEPTSSIPAVLRAWSIFFLILGRYLLWRVGLIRRMPMFAEREPDIYLVVLQMFRWRKRIRALHMERCPRDNPAVFASNHHKLDDPVDLWPCIYWASGTHELPRFIMRDDFFRGFPWDWSPFSLNDLCFMCEAVLISRDRVKLSQLRPIIQRLAQGGWFVMFPGRTRSRTGACFEYRDDIEEPGSPAFLAGLAQMRNPERQVSIIPMARSFHPIYRTSAVVFGEPLYLEKGADREAQRVLDEELLYRISELIEIHAVHIVALLMYLRALHFGNEPVSKTWLYDVVAGWAQTKPHPYIHPHAFENVGEEIEATLRFFAEKQMVRIDKENICPDAGRILSSPDWENNYRVKNPVKYWANQIIHLPAAVQWGENAVLSNPRSHL